MVEGLRAKPAVLVFCLPIVPLRGKGPSMSAENEHSDNGGVETRENGAIATSSERLVDLYREMALIRAFEEACQKGFQAG